MTSPENPDPTLPVQHLPYWRSFRYAPLSPFEGPIVELFDGVSHAAPITLEMLSSGTYLTVDDFYAAAQGIGAARVNGSRTFSTVYGHFLGEAEDRLGKYGMASPYYPYYDWASSRMPQRRGQLLFDRVKCIDTFTDRQPMFSSREQRLVRYLLKDILGLTS